MEDFASKASSQAELIVRDEWINDDISFPTKADALLAGFALSREADPTVVNAIYSLIRNPTFNPAECTLHSVAEVHSYATDYRKATDVYASQLEEASPIAIPSFVWEETLVSIGDRWVAYVYELCTESRYISGSDKSIFVQATHHTLSDLRNASLVHRCWTRPAQRQMGRVLVLRDIHESMLSAAIRSGLYGNWTQILALKGSSYLSWGMVSDDGQDSLLPNLSFLKTFLTRFPCLTTIYYRSPSASLPHGLLSAMKVLPSLNTITIVNFGQTPNRSTDEIFMRMQDWPALRSLNLVGFHFDLHDSSAVKQPLSASKLPQLSSLFISSGEYSSLHHAARIRWVCWARSPSVEDMENFVVSDIGFRRIYKSIGPFNAPEGNSTYDHETVDFAALAHEPILSWLPFVERIHLKNIYETEASQLLDMATAVRQLSWSGYLYTPSVMLPPNIRVLQLFLPEDRALDENWHLLDRELHKFLLQKKGSGLQQVVVNVLIVAGDYEEVESEFPRVYFPRSLYLCESLNISFTIPL